MLAAEAMRLNLPACPTPYEMDLPHQLQNTKYCRCGFQRTYISHRSKCNRTPRNTALFIWSWLGKNLECLAMPAAGQASRIPPAPLKRCSSSWFGHPLLFLTFVCHRGVKQPMWLVISESSYVSHVASKHKQCGYLDSSIREDFDFSPLYVNMTP